MDERKRISKLEECMSSQSKQGFSTRMIHAGQQPDPTTGAIMTPVYLSSTFVQSSPGVHKGYEYSRTHNPTRRAFEDCLASLECGKRAFAFSSGCAATATILHMLKAGDHVIAGDDMYGGTYRIFDKVFKQMGIEFSYVDLTDINNFTKALKPNTKLVWLETPTNPTLKLMNIAQISALAKKASAWVVVDNTFMSPYFQKPLLLGADMVVHSATKYIGGHSDLVGGVIATQSDELIEKLTFMSNAVGATQSPFDSFLCLRSLKTLSLRMQAHEKNAQRLAEWLEKHPKIERTVYPGLQSHPQAQLAREQMTGMGGMITIYLKGGLEQARSMLEKVKIFSLAESLGGVESLIEHPAIMTHASIPPDVRAKLGIDDRLVRLSVGIEDFEDLQQDLEQSLK